MPRSPVTYVTMLKRYGMQDASEVDSPTDRNVNLEIIKDDIYVYLNHFKYIYKERNKCVCELSI